MFTSCSDEPGQGGRRALDWAGEGGDGQQQSETLQKYRNYGIILKNAQTLPCNPQFN